MKKSFKIHRFFLKFLLGVIIVAVGGVAAFVILQISGKNRLYSKNADMRPDLSSVVNNWAELEGDGEEGQDGNKVSIDIPIVEEYNDNWEDGDVRYKGVHYRYNSEILTFLFLFHS